MSKKCYIQSIAQVSCQKPLSEEWLDAPCYHEESYVRAIEPDSKGMIAPSEARRMSKILKRTICTSLSALKESGIENPDAIITGTGMGCMENSEKFLTDMSKFGESCLKPTLFMQSTHNTISSLIAIILKCHGYNNTYSQGATSFESALLDAWLQIKNDQINNALVGSHDEVTPLMSKILRTNHPEYAFVSEASVATVLSSSQDEGPGVEISSVFIGNGLMPVDVASRLSSSDNVLLLGINGNAQNDEPYSQVLETLGFKPTTLQYKRIFGDNFSSSAIGFYVGATLLGHKPIPDFIIESTGAEFNYKAGSVTIINHSGDSTWSIIRLKRN